MKFPNRRSVVEEVGAQTEQARGLVNIADQDLLADPYTNPATRPHADRLRDEQHRQALTLQHRRQARRGRVTDRRAAAAERALEAITAARETSSAARAVLDLTRARARYMWGSLAASVVCSIGSAMSIEAWLRTTRPTAPIGLGYVVEAGLTVLATSMILLRGRLAARGTKLEPWQNVCFWALIGIPLAGSVVMSTMGSGLVGAAASVGAAAWALAAYLASRTLSTAIGDATAEVDQADEDELREQATGSEGAGVPDPRQAPHRPRTGPPDPEGRVLLPLVARPATTSGGDVADPDPDAWMYEEEHGFADEIEAFVRRQGPPDGSVTTSCPDVVGDGPQGASQRLPEGEGHLATGNRHIDADQRFDGPPERDGGESTERVIPAVEANRLKGLKTRWRITEHLAANPGHNVRQIAEALEMAESTVRRHLKAIDTDEGGS